MALRKVLHSTAEFRCRGQRAGMQLRIATRQPAGVTACVWSLVSKRRERHDLGAGAPPAIDEMRIDEAECLITRERDALTGRINGGRGGVWLKHERCGQRNNAIKVEVALCELCQAIKSL